MNTNRILSCCATITALGAAGLVVNTGSANAQQASEEQTSEVIEEIVGVEARNMHHQVEREGALGMKFETIKLNRPVSYADLDLSDQADVILLKRNRFF